MQLVQNKEKRRDERKGRMTRRKGSRENMRPVEKKGKGGSREGRNERVREGEREMGSEQER